MFANWMFALLCPQMSPRTDLCPFCNHRKYPLFVSFLLCAIMGTFKGYPSIGDASLYLGLLPLSSEIFKCKTTDRLL